MADERDEIRSRIDLVDLVSQRVSLKRAGKTFKGLCPFHEDRNPSFVVDPQTGRYKCWACGESGDIFTWVMKTENLDFIEALRELAARAGVALKSKGSSVSSEERDVRTAAMAEALSFFREQLLVHQHAQDYCRRRGLDDEALKEWEIGYAPDVGEALANVLKRKEIPLPEARSLFLVDQDASGGYYDRFRSRLMFPIRDERGSLVAFGGRLLGDGHPKYINSSDTPLYKKSRVLYGMHKAKGPMSTERKAILVEGYLDVIACHRAGVTGAVASLGTALSEDHARLLKRWVDGVIVLYDSDEAGKRAADRAIAILEKEALGVRISLMPKGEDPDTLLQKSGPEAVKAAVKGGATAAEFRLAIVEESLSPEFPEFWERVVSVLAGSKQDMETEKHILRLAPTYPGIKDGAAARERLREMIAAERLKLGDPQMLPKARPSRTQEHIPLSEPLSAPEIVIFRALLEPPLVESAWRRIVEQPEIFETGAGSQLAAAIAAAYPDGFPQGPPSSWVHAIEPEHMRQVLSEVTLDFRSENLSEQRLSDSVSFLQRQADARELRRQKAAERSPEERQEILNKLRQLNPDPRKRLEEPVFDPFA